MLPIKHGDFPYVSLPEGTSRMARIGHQGPDSCGTPSVAAELAPANPRARRRSSCTLQRSIGPSSGPCSPAPAPRVLIWRGRKKIWQWRNILKTVSVYPKSLLISRLHILCRQHATKEKDITSAHKAGRRFTTPQVSTVVSGHEEKWRINKNFGYRRVPRVSTAT